MEDPGKKKSKTRNKTTAKRRTRSKRAYAEGERRSARQILGDLMDYMVSEELEVDDDGIGLPAAYQDFDHDLEEREQALPRELMVIPMSTSMVFPSIMAPIFVSERRFIRTAESVLDRDQYVGLILSKQDTVDSKTRAKDLHRVGVVAKVIKRIKLPDGSINLLVQGVRRFKVSSVLVDSSQIVVSASYLEDQFEKSTEMDALMRSVVSYVKRLSEMNPFFTEELKLAMINAPGPATVADLVAFALSLDKVQIQEFLETLSVRKRFERLIVLLQHEQRVADVQKKITDEVNSKVSKMQREFFLKEQLKAIKGELGVELDGKEKISRTFKEKIEAAGMPEEVKKTALDELSKFETLSEQSPEFNLSRNYLDTLTSLPWNKETRDNLDLRRARRTLDQDHYGLEKVKERIIEFLAVRELKSDQKGSIICLVGPPGVGKTSIGRSIAGTMGRHFFRFSLGGMRDEAEIKGHRRTYIGAMPGKIIQGLKRAGSNNCVLMLDEIDKLGQSYQGDPASALLEVLDPEQNGSFLDHYLDVPFDLSKVLFICTANSLSTIPGPLLDRMEVIELPGYTLEEKVDIAKRYVIPKALEEHGLRPTQVKLSDATVKALVTDYAREPGMRSVQKLVATLFRKSAAEIVKAKQKKQPSKRITIQARDLKDYLGPIRFQNEFSERLTQPGVVVGLAWTQTGGDILFIEATETPGTGQLKLTGQMGEVMTESAAIAWSHVKKKIAGELEVDQDFFKGKDFHLHIPAGAIPKDGPSAGITMATALYSLLTGRKAVSQLAMTGELSLVGKVLPVGGIKEKILAAKRSGVNRVLLPEQNRKDLEEVPKYAKKGMKIHFVSQFDDVLEHALESIKPKKKTTKKKRR